MRVHRALAASASGLLLTAGGLGLSASPAAAATLSNNCADFHLLSGNISSSFSWGLYTGETFTEGETLSITITSRSGAPTLFQLQLPSGTTVASTAGPWPTTLTYVIPNTSTFGRGRMVTTGGLVNVVTSCDAPVPVSEAATIPQWVQAVGRHQDEACEVGWDASWQPWAGSVTGGWVCTRSIPALGS
jgi:hypothetical protein